MYLASKGVGGVVCDLSKDLQPMTSDIYLLKLSKDVPEGFLTNLKKQWSDLCARASRPITLVAYPEGAEFIPASEVPFDFSFALKLVDLGKKAMRDVQIKGGTSCGLCFSTISRGNSRWIFYDPNDWSKKSR